MWENMKYLREPGDDWDDYCKQFPDAEPGEYDFKLDTDFQLGDWFVGVIVNFSCYVDADYSISDVVITRIEYYAEHDETGDLKEGIALTREEWPELWDVCIKEAESFEVCDEHIK